jgi:hypothetical protein
MVRPRKKSKASTRGYVGSRSERRLRSRMHRRLQKEADACGSRSKQDGFLAVSVRQAAIHTFIHINVRGLLIA